MDKEFVRCRRFDRELWEFAECAAWRLATKLRRIVAFEKVLDHPMDTWKRTGPYLAFWTCVGCAGFYQNCRNGKDTREFEPLLGRTWKFCKFAKEENRYSVFCKENETRQP